MHEQFFNAVKNLACPLCSQELDNHDNYQRENEEYSFFYCEKCGSELTMILSHEGDVDFDFCACIHHEEKKS